MAHSRITQRRRSHPSTTWSQSTGMGGRNAPERLVAINRNHWSQWTGLGIQVAAAAWLKQVFAVLLAAYDFPVEHLKLSATG